MFRQHAFSSLCRGNAIVSRRFSGNATVDVRSRIMTELKDAMKAKNTVKSTTIRSVLTEVYSADKQKSQPIPSNKIQDIIRKAVDRRRQVADEYTKASRTDLAEKELSEAAILADFLPPQLSEEEIDRILQKVIQKQDLSEAKHPKQALGKVFKAFYSQVDKATIGSTEYVTQRAEALLVESSQSPEYPFTDNRSS